MRNILNATAGHQIPVTIDLNIQPLTKPIIKSGKKYGREDIINGNGRTIMNDQWYFTSNWPFGGMVAANVYRSYYCEKMYLSNVTIQESIGINKLMDADLQKFVSQVSDKIVFNKYGKWYRVYLRKITNRTFGIAKITPYTYTILSGSHPMYDKILNTTGLHPYEISVDWKKKFYVR